MTKIKIKDSYSRDAVVKDIFTTTKSGLEVLSWVICDILNLSHDDFKFKLVHTNIGINENIVKSEADIVVENDNMIVNVEMNTSKGRKFERKNNNYICQLVLRQTRKTSDYKKKYRKVYQININTFAVTDDDRSIVRSRVLDDKKYLEIHPLFEIYDINLAKLLEMDYNSIRKSKRSWEYLLYILGCDSNSNLEKMYKGDRLMTEVVKNIKAKVDDFDKFLYYNREILDDGNQLKDTLEDGIRIGTERGYKQGVEKGIEQGYEKGAEQNAIKIAKSMLKGNYEISEIVKITGLSFEKVKRLK